MTLSDVDQGSLREVERIVDLGCDIGYACLVLWQTWARLVLRAPSRGRSVATEAAELLRHRPGDGGPRHAVGFQASTD